MKKILTLLSAVLLVTAGSVQAQTNSDQNPRYMESQAKYMRQADSLTSQEGSTAQQTYKAYDYVQLKQEQKDFKRNQRFQRRMARAMMPNYNYYSNWNRYDNWGRYNNNFLGRPSIGYRTGNWWFGL